MIRIVPTVVCLVLLSTYIVELSVGCPHMTTPLLGTSYNIFPRRSTSNKKDFYGQTTNDIRGFLLTISGQ